jgi:catechol 2,3-dioxygenase-like lactoylglutathione lyase family enzyme
MTAQIKHIAIVTERYTLMARFYEALFGLWSFPGRVEAAAMAVSDGHVGLNFNLRQPGRQAGIDHFGFEVESVDKVLERAGKYRQVECLKRPSNRPFVGISMNDPAGNVFDLAHAETNRRDSVYGSDAAAKKTPRRVTHFLLRVMNPEMLAEFYRDVFDLIEQPRRNGDANFYLTDGTVIMVIGPWRIGDYQGTGIARPAMDHLGFKVESLEAFQRDMQNLGAANTALIGQSLTATPENEHRLNLLKSTGLGKLQLADPDGNLINVSEDE